MSVNLCLLLLLCCQLSVLFSASTRTNDEAEKSVVGVPLFADVSVLKRLASDKNLPSSSSSTSITKPLSKHSTECVLKNFENPKHVAQRLLEEGNFEQARPCLEQATRKYPHNSELWSTLVFVEKELGNTRAALAAMLSLHALLPSTATKTYVQHLIELSEMYLEVLDEENSTRVLAEALDFAPTQVVFNTIYNRLVEIQEQYNPQQYEPIREDVSWLPSYFVFFSTNASSTATETTTAKTTVAGNNTTIDTAIPATITTTTALASSVTATLWSSGGEGHFPVSGSLKAKGLPNGSMLQTLVKQSITYIFYLQDQTIGVSAWDGFSWIQKKLHLSLPSVPLNFAVALVKDKVYLWTWHEQQIYLSTSIDLLIFSSPVVVSFPFACNSSLVSIFTRNETLFALQTCSYALNSPYSNLTYNPKTITSLAYNFYLQRAEATIDQNGSNISLITWSNASFLTRPNVDCAVRRILTISNSSWLPRSAFRSFNNAHLVFFKDIYFLFFSSPFVDVHPAVLRALFKEDNVTASSNTIYYLISKEATGPFLSPRGSPNLPGVVRDRENFVLSSGWKLVATDVGLSVIRASDGILTWGEIVLDFTSSEVLLTPRPIIHSEL